MFSFTKLTQHQEIAFCPIKSQKSMNISNEASGKQTSLVSKKSRIKQVFINEKLSLQPFLDYFSNGNSIEEVSVSNFPKKRKLLERFLTDFPLSQHPEDRNNKDTFDLIEKLVNLGVDHQHRSFNLFTMPGNSNTILFNNVRAGFLSDEINSSVIIEKIKNYIKENPTDLRAFLYQKIWNHYMPTQKTSLPPLIFPLNTENSEKKYFLRLYIDQRFTSIETILNQDEIIKILRNTDLNANDTSERFALLEQQLPLQSFQFTGFKKIQVTDVTTEQITKNIGDQILNADHKSPDLSYVDEIVEALDIASESEELQFGLFPMLKINEQFTFKDPRRNKDQMAGRFVNADTKELLYDFLAKIYCVQPRTVYLQTLTDDIIAEYEYLKILKSKGVKSFALVPVYYQQSLIGVLEIMTQNSEALTRSTLIKLASFFPVLALHFKKSVDRFNQLLEDIVREKFTSLQSSVQWRFNIAAWNYLQNNKIHHEHTEVEKIAFEQVYPLYGAIDIKNSTVNRNAAMRNDMGSQLEMLKTILFELKAQSGFELLDEKLYSCEKWLKRIYDPSDNLLEEEISYFLEMEIHLFLKDLQHARPETSPILETYFNSCDVESKTWNTNRQQLEHSMNMVINEVNNEIDKIQLQAQANYPCFFDKFRTDGVEYDIYIGQSISPEKPFKQMYIQNLRLLQLKNMIAVARKIHTIRALLPVPIDITQLIFVQPHFIDITFRTDERRFDVEGAYNIRYHIVKKRIDKVLIKNTNERLTSPGKIAIVYFNQREMEEFMVHINFLQQENLLTANTELLELEPLQGVVGLKALRVEINLPGDL
jgi:hypothetical protein